MKRKAPTGHSWFASPGRQGTLVADVGFSQQCSDLHSLLPPTLTHKRCCGMQVAVTISTMQYGSQSQPQRLEGQPHEQ